MLSAQETQLVMEKHFRACYRYWLTSGYSKDKREAFANAINDVRNIKRNPLTMQGEELDIETRDKFVRYREQDLGIKVKF